MNDIPGLISVASRHSAADTLARFIAQIEARQLTLFAHIDHAAGARAVGLALRATDLLLFGNARGGTPLMQARQTMGIDLPLKAIIFEDERGTAWLAYNDVRWLASRHDVPAEAEPALEKLSKLLESMANAVIA
jgi:uncharacterized protein (DUF302 family)